MKNLESTALVYSAPKKVRSPLAIQLTIFASGLILGAVLLASFALPSYHNPEDAAYINAMQTKAASGVIKRSWPNKQLPETENFSEDARS